MAVLLYGIFWLHSYTVGGSGATSSFFIYENASYTEWKRKVIYHFWFVASCIVLINFVSVLACNMQIICFSQPLVNVHCAAVTIVTNIVISQSEVKSLFCKKCNFLCLTDPKHFNRQIPTSIQLIALLFCFDLSVQPLWLMCAHTHTLYTQRSWLPSGFLTLDLPAVTPWPWFSSYCIVQCLSVSESLQVSQAQ